MTRMNKVAVAIHMMVKAINVVLRVGNSAFYLILTSITIIFSFIVVFYKRREHAGVSAVRGTAAAMSQPPPSSQAQVGGTSRASSSHITQSVQTTPKVSRKVRLTYPHLQSCLVYSAVMSIVQ